uniref:Uncharacterized protein n=1 Tax=Brassica campestris TaxID=3711 RepID=A0A3P6C9E7_BRACM|nr:unnamed protein product [Brassica rapa]
MKTLLVSPMKSNASSRSCLPTLTNQTPSSPSPKCGTQAGGSTLIRLREEELRGLDRSITVTSSKLIHILVDHRWLKRKLTFLLLN